MTLGRARAVLKGAGRSLSRSQAGVRGLGPGPARPRVEVPCPSLVRAAAAAGVRSDGSMGGSAQIGIEGSCSLIHTLVEEGKKTCVLCALVKSRCFHCVSLNSSLILGLASRCYHNTDNQYCLRFLVYDTGLNCVSKLIQEHNKLILCLEALL